MSLTTPSRKTTPNRGGLVTVRSRGGKQVYVRDTATRDTLRRADDLAMKLQQNKEARGKSR